MKAIRVHQFGPPEVMQVEDVPDPSPGPVVVIETKAFGKIVLVP
jgi:NADPH:quinone reductase-like Zn-dependent oxidoreductase